MTLIDLFWLAVGIVVAICLIFGVGALILHVVHLHQSAKLLKKNAKIASDLLQEETAFKPRKERES